MGDVENTATAEITMNGLNGSGLSLRAVGAYELGIGRVGFVLVDLGQELADSVVDRKDVDYSASFPKRVREEWTSGALVPGASYRAFFHVYDRSGVNLVAYDRRDFTCDPRRRP
jgi:hypothetical protein